MVGAVPDSTVIEQYPLPEGLRTGGVNEKSWGYAVMLENEMKVAFEVCEGAF